MLTLRKDQTDAFKASMRNSFADRMVVRMRQEFPEDCEILGDAQTRRVVDLGIDRAAAHGFGTRGSVCDYLTLMFILGSYFDEDPMLPWAAEVLRKQEKEDANAFATMEELYARANEYLEEVHGEDGDHYTKALLRARRIPFESVADPEAGDVRTRLGKLYPEKFRALSDGSYGRLTDLARVSAEEYGLGKEVGRLVYLGLMFLLGSHFGRDPQHPWAVAVLQDQSLRDPAAKARRLHDAAMERLDQSLAANRPTERS
jgi:hypothetical protein